MGIAGVLAAQLVGSWLETILFKMPQTSSQIHQQLSSMTTNPWYFLTIGLALPILEELAFRKVLFGNLVNVTGIFGGALIASLLFAVTQPGGHWLSATLVGLVLAYDYRHTGAISTPIIAMSVPYGWFGFITLPMPYKRNRILIAPITTISYNGK